MNSLNRQNDRHIPAYFDLTVLQGIRTPIYKLYLVKNDDLLSLIRIWIGGEIL